MSATIGIWALGAIIASKFVPWIYRQLDEAARVEAKPREIVWEVNPGSVPCGALTKVPRRIYK